MSLIRTITVDTVNAETMHDIELSGNSTELDYLNVYNWYLSGSSNLDNIGYTPSLQYPFERQNKYEEKNANAPFARFTYTPIITAGGSLLSACVTIDDPTIPEDIVQCKEFDGGIFDLAPVDSVVIAELLPPGYTNWPETSAGTVRVETLFIKNQNIVEYVNSMLVWASAFGDGSGFADIKYTYDITTTHDDTVFDEDFIPFTSDGYYFLGPSGGLSAYYLAIGEVFAAFRNGYEIIHNVYPINYPEVDYNGFATNVITDTGTITSKTVIKKIPKTDIGSIGYVHLSGEHLDSYSYKITTAHNSSNVTYNVEETVIGEDNHVVAAELNGDFCDVYITPVGRVAYTCYFYDLSSYNSNNNTFSAVDVDNSTELILSDNTRNQEYNQYGVKRTVFIRDENNVSAQVHDINSVWSEESDKYVSNSAQTLYSTPCSIDIQSDKLKDESVGLKVYDATESGYWEIAGFNNESPIQPAIWNNFNNTAGDVRIIDTISRSSSNACTWNIVTSIPKYDHTAKTIVYSTWNSDAVPSGVNYVTKDVTNTGNLDLYRTVQLEVSGNDSDIALIASGYDNYELQGFRTQVNNISSFYVEDSNPFDINTSPYDDNIWTVYCSGAPGIVLADIYANKDNYNVELRSTIMSTGYSITGFNFSVLPDSSDYKLRFEPTYSTTDWVVSGYRIDNRDQQEINTQVYLSDTNILTLSADAQYKRYNSTWWLTNSFRDIYSTFLTDIVWGDVINQASFNSYYIANIQEAFNTEVTGADVRGYRPLTDIDYSATFDGDYAYLKATPLTESPVAIGSIGWSVSGFDYTKELNNISTSIDTAVTYNSADIFDYIFSHPNAYNVTISVSTADAGLVYQDTANDFFNVSEISPSAVLGISLSSIDELDSYFTPVPSVSAISYYTGTLPELSSSNTLYFHTFNTLPGSFPIGEIHIDFGDDTGITKIYKTSNGVGSLSKNTEAFDSNKFNQNTVNSYDPRNVYLKHTFSSEKSAYTITLSAFSSDTRDLDTQTITVSGFQGIDITNRPKRLINSANLSDNNMVYNIIVPE